MLKNTLVAVTLLTGLCSAAAVASSLSSTFHEYSTPGGTFDGSSSVGGMNVYVGPGYSYRNNINMNRSFYNIEFPSWNAGCSGIDAFAGSFSMITRDELVQMGRGIMQGAPGYFFNLAIDSICPGCAANMKDLQNRLNSWNQAAQNSCENAWGVFSDATGINDLASWTKGKMETVIQQEKWLSGAIPDYGDWMARRSEPVEIGQCGPSIECAELEDIQWNLVKLALHGPATPSTIATYDFFGQTDAFTDVEIAQSLFGTLINTLSSSGDLSVTDTRVSIENSMLKLEHLFDTTPSGGAPVISDAPIHTQTLYILRCNSPIAGDELAQRCLNPSPHAIHGFEGIVTRFERVLPGIVRKISLRQPLTDAELDFTRRYRLNYWAFAQRSTVELSPAFARIAGIAMARQRVAEFVYQFEAILEQSASLPLKDQEGNTVPFTSNDVRDLLLGFRHQYQAIDAKWAKEYESKISELKTTIEIQNIASLTGR